MRHLHMRHQAHSVFKRGIESEVLNAMLESNTSALASNTVSGLWMHTDISAL